MKTLTKKQKIDFIRKLVDEQKITAYVIAKNTDLTESGIQRVLNGITENPHINTVNGIYNYLIRLYPMDVNKSITGPEIEEINESFARNKEEINKQFGLLLETLVKKIVDEQTRPEFIKINENILALFKNQMELNRPGTEPKIKPLLNNGSEPS